MLQIEIEGKEYWDEGKEEFVTTPGTVLRLEHSLKSLREWESKWKKPFLHQKDMTLEELIDYIRCMTIGPPKDQLTYMSITGDQLAQIKDYMNDSMTATTFRAEEDGPKNRSITTAEILYYEMSELNIPYSCERWNLNQLLALIRVCAIKRAPKKKGKGGNAANNRKNLNKQRRNQYGTHG